jgi:aminoglycoside phosphotransferase (APT) family kinase protein
VSGVDELREQLAAVVGAAVTELVRLSGGASRETWAFDTASGDRLILQRERAGVVRGNGGITAEASLLRAAGQVGVPVAELIAAGGPDDGLGASFIVTRRIEGETIARKILRDDEFTVARTALAGQCGRALAGIHAIDPAVAPSLDEPDQVEMYRDVLDGFKEPHPAFELGFRWLNDNRPPTTRSGVVHGDFRLGNLIVDESGLAAVLDWEIAHIGDPMEDLGWLCVKAWRFGGTHPVAGVGEYAELFDAYGAAAGVNVDPEVVRWWEVLGTLKWGVMCIMQASAHLFGMTRSVELATIGRRVCEQEYDLLAILP